MNVPCFIKHAAVIKAVQSGGRANNNGWQLLSGVEEAVARHPEKGGGADVPGTMSKRQRRGGNAGLQKSWVGQKCRAP